MKLKKLLKAAESSQPPVRLPNIAAVAGRIERIRRIIQALDARRRKQSAEGNYVGFAHGSHPHWRAGIGGITRLEIELARIDLSSLGIEKAA
jgi:hypothetical protein